MKQTKKKITQGSKTILSLVVGLLMFAFYETQDMIKTSLPDAVVATKPPPKIGEASALYSTADNLKKIYLDAIRKAKKSIFLIIYSLTDSEIILELKKKAEQGVEVCVVCDAKASGRVDRTLGKKIQTVRRIPDGLMHQKILVIDEKETWLGSANMTGDSLLEHGNLVAALPSQEFAQAILKKGKLMAQDDGYEPPLKSQRFNVGGQWVELWFFPDDPKGVKKILELIEGAKKTIKVAMFTWTRQDLAHAIIQAAKRGVKVEVVLDRQSSNGTSQKIATLLKQNKIPLKVNSDKGLLHHKFVYIDSKILVNGSANWTKAAFTQNDDCFIIIDNLNETQTKKMNDLWKMTLKKSEPY